MTEDARRQFSDAILAMSAAYGTPPRVSTQWAVAWGAEDGLNDGKGCVETYDDEQDAREHLAQYPDGSVVVSRMVISCPWVTGDDTQERTEETAAESPVTITYDLPPVSPGRLEAPKLSEKWGRS